MSTTTATGPGRKVLLVDDDASLLRNYRWCLEDAGFAVTTAQNGQQADQRLAQDVFDLCFLDLLIGEESGLDLLPKVKAQAPWMRVVMATAENTLATAVEAMRRGAVDYLVKPFAPEAMVRVAERQAEARRLELKIGELERRLDDNNPEQMLTSAHPELLRVYELARSVADTDATVLILGESGTGKNVLARAVHEWSQRKDAAFSTINCPSLSAELLESELFGHVKGAFTGATENRQGRVQVADKGTLFLDEIGDFPYGLQAKLLRFAQDREYERVGDPHTRKADVRLIAATNRDLNAMVAAGTFREDLLYRLNVITVELPALRQRPDDIPALSETFLRRFAASYRRPARRFSDAAMGALRAAPWPGNLRELRNTIERLAILCPQEVVEREHLPATVLGAEPNHAGVARVGANISLEQLERAHIEAILGSAATLDEAARTLGVDPSTLYRKRKQYGL